MVGFVGSAYFFARLSDVIAYTLCILHTALHTRECRQEAGQGWEGLGQVADD